MSFCGQETNILNIYQSIKQKSQQLTLAVMYQKVVKVTSLDQHLEYGARHLEVRG